MNLGLWPEAVPFDPDDGAGSRELDAFLEGVSFPRAALVVAGRGTDASEWAARAAIGLARALEASGHNVLLADLGFEAPSLHGLLSESTVEGLADAILFGSSLERVTVLPAGQTFEFVPAGAFTPDPAALRADPAWGRMLAEMASRNTLFLGYTPFDAPGLDRLVERIPSVVILAETEEASRTAAWLPEEIRIEALIRPARPLAEPPVEEAEPAGVDLGTAAVPEAVLTGAVPEETAGAATRTASGIPVEAETASIAAGGSAEPGSMPGGVAVPEAGARTADADFDRIRLPKDEAREALIVPIENEAEHLGRVDHVERFLDHALGRSVGADDQDDPVDQAGDDAGVLEPHQWRRVEDNEVVAAARFVEQVDQARRLEDLVRARRGLAGQDDVQIERGPSPGDLRQREARVEDGMHQPGPTGRVEP